MTATATATALDSGLRWNDGNCNCNGAGFQPSLE
jgi:hypothetical protein